MPDSTPATELRTAAARLRKYDTDVLRPGDGLALADWLEDTARYAVLYADITVASTGAAPVETDYDSLTLHALKAARRFLCRCLVPDAAGTVLEQPASAPAAPSDRAAEQGAPVDWKALVKRHDGELKAALEDRIAAEAHRLALSEALGLGTGASWDAIRDRAAGLRRPVDIEEMPEDAARFGRYLEAVRCAVAPRGPWGPEHDAAARAVMADADAEQQEMANTAVRFNAALMRQNEKLRAEVERLRTMYNVADARTSDLIDERDQLLEAIATVEALPVPDTSPGWALGATWALDQIRRLADEAQPEPVDIEESPEDAARRFARSLHAVEQLCAGRPDYHTITVKALLTAMSDADQDEDGR